MDITDEDIWIVVREIRDSPYRRLDAFQKKIREDREWFFTKYPTLAEMCLTSEVFDENALPICLHKRARWTTHRLPNTTLPCP